MLRTIGIRVFDADVTGSMRSRLVGEVGDGSVGISSRSLRFKGNRRCRVDHATLKRAPPSPVENREVEQAEGNRTFLNILPGLLVPDPESPKLHSLYSLITH